MGSYPKDPKDKSLFELANSNNYTYPYLLRESESQAVSKPEDREERKISPRIPHPHHTNQSSMNMKSATSLTSSSVFTASKNSHPWAPDRHDHHEVLQRYILYIYYVCVVLPHSLKVDSPQIQRPLLTLRRKVEYIYNIYI